MTPALGVLISLGFWNIRTNTDKKLPIQFECIEESSQFLFVRVFLKWNRFESISAIFSNYLINDAKH